MCGISSPALGESWGGPVIQNLEINTVLELRQLRLDLTTFWNGYGLR
jgi:hypothetical protein